MQTTTAFKAYFTEFADVADSSVTRALDMAAAYLPFEAAPAAFNHAAAHLLVVTVPKMLAGSAPVEDAGNERIMGVGSMSRSYTYTMPPEAGGREEWDPAFWTQTQYGQQARRMALAFMNNRPRYVGH